MSVVSDSSPLINLARIGELGLLRQLYGELLIPEAVWREVVAEGVNQPGAEDVARATWIKKRVVKNGELVQALRQDLDAGEAESIALALETVAELLLMDERLGRETARFLGVHYVGLIGVITEAKHKGIIRAVKPPLDSLINLAGFRVKASLHERVLHNEGET